MFSPKQLKKSRFGSSCMFIPLSRDRAVKLYNSRKERDFAVKLQRKAYKKRLGPRTYGLLNLSRPYIGETWNGKTELQYGYVTQIATQRYCSNRQLEELEAKLSKAGFGTGDTCDVNVGFLGKRLVCIDFDMGSM